MMFYSGKTGLKKKSADLQLKICRRSADCKYGALDFSL